MATQRLELIVDIDSSGAITGVKKIESAIGSADKAAQNLGKTQKSVFAEIKAGYLAIAGVIGGVFVKSLLDAEKQYAEFVEKSDALTNQFGINTKVLLQQLTEASGGQISNFDLIKSASRAMALGVTTDGATLAKLLAFATSKSDSLGKSALEVFDTLVEGIGRGSARVLTSVGINKEAFDRQGFSIDGVTSKSQLLSITLSESAKYFKEVGESSTSLADKLDIQKAKYENLKLEIGEVVSRGMNRLRDAANAVGDVLFASSRAAAEFKKNLAEASQKGSLEIEMKAYADSTKAIQNKFTTQMDLDQKIDIAERTMQTLRKRRLGDQDDFERALEKGKEARNSKEIDDAFAMTKFQAEHLAKSVGDEKAANEILKNLKDQRDKIKKDEEIAAKDLADTLKNIRQNDVNDEIRHLDNLLKNQRLSAEDRASLEGKKLDIIKKINEEAGKLSEDALKKEEERIKKRIELFQQIAGMVSKVGSTISDIQEFFHNDEMRRIEEEKNAKLAQLEVDNQYSDALKKMDDEDRATKEENLQAEIDAAKAAGDTKTANEKQRELDRMKLQDQAVERDKQIADQKAAIDKDAKKKEYDAELKSFGFQKALKIGQSIIATATAVVNALATPIIGPALAIIAGISGAAQTAIIAAEQPPAPPAFAFGGTLGGGPTSGDKTLFRGNAGETILNTTQGQNLFNSLDRAGLLSGQSGGSVVNNSSSRTNNTQNRTHQFFGPVYLQSSDFDDSVDKRFKYGGNFS